MVFAALRGLINGLQSPALERHVNLALSMTVGSLGPSACLLIWSFYKVVVVVAVQAVNDSRGNTSVSPDLRTCCACRAYQHACDGLAFKFTEQMVDSELPSPNPRRSELSTILD
jgi:hypothetical protein